MFGIDTLPGFLPSLFWGIITISFLVFVHEAGHALAARALGLKVSEFFIGLPGPKISFKIGETTYGVTAIPFGGYVRIPALEGSGPGAELGTMTEEERAEYAKVPTWKRLVVLSAGIVTNLLLGIVLMTVLISSMGQPIDQGYVNPVEGGPAAVAGLPDEARILSIDAVPVETFGEIAEIVSEHSAGDMVTVVYQVAGGAERSLEITLETRPTDAGQAAHPDGVSPVYMGVAPHFVEFESIPLGESIATSFRMIGMTAEAIGGLFNPATFQQTVDGSASIIGMSVLSANAAQTGIMEYAWLIAAISISLGLLNLLPIPPLDGGKIVFEVIQKVTRRPVPQSIQVGLSLFGFVLLITFMLYMVFQDILRLAG